MSTVLRPTVNADHIIVTTKLDVEWSKVPVERRALFLKQMESDAAIHEAQLKEATDGNAH